MNRLGIRQQNDAQITTVHAVNFRPSTDSAIHLDDLLARALDDLLDPSIPDYGTIRTHSCDEKILRAAHD